MLHAYTLQAASLSASLVICVTTQVEVNTISSSFGCLCTLVGRMHRYIMEHQGAYQQVSQQTASARLAQSQTDCKAIVVE